MITARDIEAWAMRVLERVSKNTFQEDALVELKRELPEPYKAARRIAGHCNAARGDTVLWLIGVDETCGIVGCKSDDLAETLPQIWQYFLGERPIVTEVSIEFSGVPCMALAFSALKVPYLVKNPQFGAHREHVIESEIPWRDGTRVRTAARDEVMRLLLDFEYSPQVEFFWGKVWVAPKEGRTNSESASGIPVQVQLQFYVMPRSEAPIVIPLHRIEGHISDSRRITKSSKFTDFQFSSQEQKRLQVYRLLARRSPSATSVRSEQADSIRDTGSELIIRRAAHIEAFFQTELPAPTWGGNDCFELQMTLFAGPDRIPLQIRTDALKKER